MKRVLSCAFEMLQGQNETFLQAEYSICSSLFNHSF